MDAPKVFLSHASDDKDRFVEGFARRLRSKGVDAWLDAWEINPGDNPVQKIFEEGLKQPAAIILVMSATSVKKPWVLAELDHAFVKRVEGNTKLIPIRLDNCTMPQCLLTTRWETIEDPGAYDHAFDRVLNAIFGHYSRPALGEAPAYAKALTVPIAKLDRIDSLVFESACRVAIKREYPLAISEAEWLDSLKDFEVPRQRLLESQEILQEKGFVRLLKTIGPPDTIYSFSITVEGFEAFAVACLPEFTELRRKAMAVIASMDKGSSLTGNSLALELGEPLRVIEHILESLERRNLIKILRQQGGSYMTVYSVSMELRQAAANGL